MHLRLSFQNRIFIVLVIIVVLTLLVVWTVVRPKYEASVISERLTNVQQLQMYAVENLDRTIAGWSDATRFIASQVTERPRDGEIILRTMMTLHPEIIQIKIHSSKLSDELTSQNTSYPTANVQVKDDAWVMSKIDTLLQIAWLNDTLPHQQFFVMRTRFQVQNIPFVLTIVWDAIKLNSLMTKLPLGENFLVSIQSKSTVILRNISPFQPIVVHSSEERMSTPQSMYQGEETWRVLTSAFQTAQLWIIIAIPEKTILRPVKDLLFYSTSLVICIAFLMLVVGWILSFQINRPIARLVKDVQRLGNLDFTQAIQIPAMKDLRGMGETIELMRQVLERHQRLNVEKIILEEWKNKLFMTHSNDMIGFTNGTGEFVFRNDKLDDFCASLLPTRTFSTKSDILTHPSIIKTKETVRDEITDNLQVHLNQSEIRAQTDSTVVNYYHVNDLSIIRSGENLGSLLIFHDETHERLMDKMKTDMINVIVHELRNPVGSIMGFAEILLHDPKVTAEEQKEFHQVIYDNSLNLNNLIDRFLNVSRLESRRVEHPKVLTDIIAIVKAVVDSQKPQLLKKSLTAELEIQWDIPKVVVSPDLFREAILNLLSNAVKYGGPDRIINLSLSMKDKNIIFSIVDHGYGIPPEAHQKLFTKFYRVHNPKATEEVGTGLGLAYVKEIATYHNGSISMESDPAIGCKFTITIPAITSEPSIENPTEG
ncbi:MAG: HAMP domain-containing sensor histidine kinase [Bacteroidota bacterium]